MRQLSRLHLQAIQGGAAGEIATNPLYNDPMNQFDNPLYTDSGSGTNPLFDAGGD